MIKRLDENVPIIFLTALGDEESEVRGFELKADDYISKPFSFNILIRDEHNWSFKKWILIRDEKIGKLGLLVIKWPKKGQTIPMRIIKCKILGC